MVLKSAEGNHNKKNQKKKKKRHSEERLRSAKFFSSFFCHEAEQQYLKKTFGIFEVLEASLFKKKKPKEVYNKKLLANLKKNLKFFRSGAPEKRQPFEKNHVVKTESTKDFREL
jgi:hypothetical protein